jgi:CBS domain-containing protein
MEGVDVLEIVLHPFGGLARLKHEPETPRAEFRIAIAGPAASFALAVAFAVLMALANAVELKVLGLLLFWLAVLNFTLAVFNLFPGYPLDGGRVLRAYLWRRGKDLNEATILTGLFLFDAAKGIIREMREFEQISVEEAMQLPVTIEPESDVQNFVDTVLPLHRRSIFLVAKNKQFYGFLLLEDLKKLAREDWRAKKIRDVMRPVTPDHFVEASALLTEAKILMRENGIGALGVIDGRGDLVGFLQRGRIRKRS